MSANFKTVPRLYVENSLGQDHAVEHTTDQLHYMRNVLRKDEGDQCRLFNGQDGEWLYEITSLSKKKMQSTPLQQIREQPKSAAPIILFFAPLKKTQTDWVVQKATELGVTEICPVTTDFSNTTKVRTDRWLSTAIEASEQSERLTIPGISQLTNLRTALRNFPSSGVLNVALERMDGNILKCKYDTEHPCGLIIGPEGGFSDDEKQYFLSNDRIHTFSLGENVLRAETAAVVGLGLLKFSAAA